MPGSILNGLALDATLTGGTAKTKIIDNSGNVAGSVDCISLRGTAVAQSGTYFAPSAANSTTAQLAAGATFTGTVDNFFSQQSISVIGVSDQPLTVTVYQYIDAGGANLVASMSFTVAASTGFSRCIPAAGNYFKITVQNTGASTTTTLNIDTVTGTLQSQTQAGNLPVALSEVSTGVTVPVRVTDQTATFSLASATNGGAITGFNGAGAATVQVTGTWSGTLQIQLSSDGTNWLPLTGSNVVLNTATGAYVSSGNITTTGIYQVPMGGNCCIRVNCTVYTSGTITGTVRVGAGSAAVTGLALDATLTGGTAKTQLVSSGGNAAAVSTAGAVSTQVVDTGAAISINGSGQSSGSITGLNQAATVTVTLTGAFTATQQVQISGDNGTTWVNVTGSNNIVNMATGAYMASGNLTAIGVYQLCVSGIQAVRVINTAYTSGTVTGNVRVTAAPAMFTVEGVPAVTVSSGTITTVTTVTTVTTCSTVTTVGSVTAANLNSPGSIADVASAAFTTVGTLATGTFTPTFGTSYIVSIPVTIVTGTTPTYDVVIQESDDAGTNWFDVYHFPRITATGIYRSPKLPLTGNRVRYNQTGAGTTPSFTRAINRLQCSDSTSLFRQLYDRAISLTTLNATTAVLLSGGCSGVQLVINIGAATTAPTLALEGSDDGGASWYTLGTLLGVASSTVMISVPGVSPGQLRGRISVIGNTVTAGYILLKAY